MPKKSNWFVVATEGATVDGRQIERQWLSDIAETYDPKTYGARINLEHFHLFWFDPELAHSKCYGDVLAVKAEENDEGKLQLYAQIEPTDELVELVKSKQKVYTSIEVRTNFAKTGKAYLTGLAVTDTPASLGTQYLSFTTKDGAKQGEIFTTEAVECSLTFAEEPVSFFEKMKAMFSKEKADTAQHKADVEARFAEHEQAQLLLAEKFTELEEKLKQAEAEKVALRADFEKLSADLTALQSRVDVIGSEPEHGYTPRPEITGGELNNERVF